MEKEICRKHQFSISEKKITVYAGDVDEKKPDRDGPVIYLNTFADEGEQVYHTLSGREGGAFTLVVISNLVWERDMAPWDIPSVSEKDTPFTGGADEYLQLLTGKILPESEKYVKGHVLWRGLAGYSLAGLFALYSLYHTGHFSRMASISGSLWFPGFKEYVFTHEMKKTPEYLYLSLGDREGRTRNPYMRNVQTATEEIRDFYIEKEIDTEYQLNPGGHFKNTVQRTAAGIAWMLEKGD